MRFTGLGVDVLEIKRFDVFKKRQPGRFLLKNYSKRELAYCFSFKDPGPHLAGIFAAKEAVFKALGREKFLFSAIEIRRDKNNRPTVWIKNRREKSIFLSISHTAGIVVAIAIKQ